MISDYVSIAWRRLAAAPVYSAVSIVGLAIGLACFIFAMLYVDDELSYDDFWSKAGRIFLVETDIKVATGGDPVHYENTYPQIGPMLAGNLSGATSVARLTRLDFLASSDEQRFYETVWFLDPSLLDIFDVEFLAGTREEALRLPMTVVLTQSYATKFFGAEALGQYITLDGKFKLRVAGVIKDLPANTHLRMGILSNVTSMESMNHGEGLRQWRIPSMKTYVLLDDAKRVADANRQLAAFTQTHLPEAMRDRASFSLTEIGELRKRQSEFGGINTLPVMLLVGALVLGMACINTINLATARGAERTKELGVRKVLGASRAQLIRQFLAEAILTAFVSLIVAVLIVELLLPSFNGLLDKHLTLDYFNDPTLIGRLLLLTLVTGLLAGTYPAFVLSKFEAADVFRGNVHFGTGASGFRTAMVVVQFGLAVTLSIATIFVYLQMNHVRRLDMGFDGANVVVLENMSWTEIRPQYEALRQELLRNPNIKDVTSSLAVPGREFSRVGDFYISGGDATDAVSLHRMSIGFDFFRTYGIDFVAGRDFARDYGTDVVQPRPSDSDEKPIFSVVINETAAKQLGWTDPQQALGQLLHSADNSWKFGGRIIGVVSDFHILAGHGPIAPYVYIISPKFINFASVRLTGTDVPETLEYIDETWNRIIPQYPIVRSFLDESLQAAFLQWERNGAIMITLSVLAVVIAALGCFGLAAYSAKCRRKEIGMRKVLGASVTDVTSLLTWDFSKPILLANLLAAPVAYYVVQKWLEGYAYRIDTSALVFLAVALLSVVLSAVVVSFHTIKVASTSPAVTFRHL